MGFILSKFKAKKKTSKERLEEIEKEVREIARFQIDTELKQKRIIGRIVVYSSIVYFIFAIGLYFLAPRGRPWMEQILYFLPLFIFPLLMFLAKKATAWYFQNKISNNREKYGELRKEKEKILEDVMENETFKVAKEILEKFAPKELLPKYLAEQERQGSPLQGLNTPANLQDGLRRRPQSMGGTSTPLRGGFRASFPQSPITRPMRGPGPPGQYLRQPTNAFQYGRPQLSIMGPAGATGRASIGPMSSQPPPSYMMPLPPTNPTMHNRGSGWFDKIVDYVVGDGVANRFALICRYCATHNGLATSEDFPYTGFRCVFCHQFNPPKEVRPTAPKLPVNQVLIEEMEQSTSTAKSETSSVSEDGSPSMRRRGSKKDAGAESEAEDGGPIITLAESPKTSEGNAESADETVDTETEERHDDTPAEFGSPMSVISLSEATSSKRPLEDDNVIEANIETVDTPLASDLLDLSDKPANANENATKTSTEPSPMSESSSTSVVQEENES